MAVKYEVLEVANESGFHVLEISEGEFKGRQFNFGGVQFGDENPDGTINAHFEYDLLNGEALTEHEQSKFEKLLSEVMLQLLEDMVAKNEVVYAGGT